ncbi:Enhancer of polycomb-like protein 1 [Podosphaera aphanis]|nr:Enhancer of polycomb-like protein 1 [Podosphaera aphanis]
MRPQAPARQVRIRKLAKNTPQPVLREDQIESAEYASLQNQYNVETGVEKNEEKEYHLQAALAASSGEGDKDSIKEIPAPPAQETANLDYDSLYSLTFEKPATYIRFSQTVEDCTGCQYDTTAEDEVFLKNLNENSSAKCSEDDFEEIMEIFEETSELQAPHAPIDGYVVSFDDMNMSLKRQVDQKILVFTKAIYEYWKIRRKESGNHPLQPSLKFEKNQEKDDGDPYVCFRRRDARQTRKTRARDSQSTDKLRKLRKELEDGRALIEMAYRRELLKRDLLAAELGVFEKRMRVKETKIQLGIKGDDQDLINERPQRRREPGMQRTSGPSQLRISCRSDSRSIDSDLILLSDEQDKKESRLRAEIEEKAKLHRSWNEAHIDLTREPLSPIHGNVSESGFRTVTTQYQLVTPPSSVISESFDQPTPSQENSERSNLLPFKLKSPSEDGEGRGRQAYRRRFGRGGRLWIDRRGTLSSPTKDIIEPVVLDRWKYDREDSDEQPVYELDPYSTTSLRFRATIPFPPYLIPQRPRPEDRTLHPARVAGVSPSNGRSASVIQQPTTQPPT